jgi:tetratricopeptide (TPR) repeat protein
MTRLSLTLFGGFELRADAGAVVRLPTRKAEALLAYLALAPDRGHALGVAAVIGREFEFPLLSRAAGLDDRHAGEGVEELVRRRLLQNAEDRFEFTHTYVREVAYADIVTPRRRLLHREVAASIEELGVADREEHEAALVAHYQQGEVWDKAVGALARVADRAACRAAHDDALVALGTAMPLVDRLPGRDGDARRIDLVLRSATSLAVLGRFRESLDLLLAHRASVESLGDPGWSGPYAARLALTWSYLGDEKQMIESARCAIDDAARSGDAVAGGMAYFVLARHAFWAGRPRAGVESARSATALLEGTPERRWLALAEWMLGYNLWLLGDFDAALAAAARADEIGVAIGDVRLQASARWTTGLVETTRGAWQAGIAACRESLALASDPFTVAGASAFLGYACLAAGDPVEARAHLERSAEALSRLQHRAGQSWAMGLLGDAYARLGERARARELLVEGRRLADEARFPIGVAWAERALGRLEGEAGALADAERHLTIAARLFDEIEARVEAARTRQELARYARADERR